MVLLTMTPAVVAAVGLYNKLRTDAPQEESPSLQDPKAGHPISHGQLIDISKFLKQHSDEMEETDGLSSIHLSDLLRGCGIYVPPPPPKPEKSDEYKALMARLRKEEEAATYRRMLDSSDPTTMSHRFPTAGASQGFLFPPQPSSTTVDDDEVTFADINRQMALIANVLISILACSIGVWKTAWHWDVPARLALSMVSSIVVAAAEVAIYMGYIGRLEEARKKEGMKVERREVGESWVIEANAGKGTEAVAVGKVQRKEVLADGIRQRGKAAEKS